LTQSAPSSPLSVTLSLRERERLPACWLALKALLLVRQEDSLRQLLQDDRGHKPASLDSLLGDVVLKQRTKVYADLLEEMTKLEKESMND